MNILKNCINVARVQHRIPSLYSQKHRTFIRTIINQDYKYNDNKHSTRGPEVAAFYKQHVACKIFFETLQDILPTSDVRLQPFHINKIHRSSYLHIYLLIRLIVVKTRGKVILPPASPQGPMKNNPIQVNHGTNIFFNSWLN